MTDGFYGAIYLIVIIVVVIGLLVLFGYLNRPQTPFGDQMYLTDSITARKGIQHFEIK